MVALSDYEKLRIDQIAEDAATALARLDQHDAAIATKVSQDAFHPVRLIAFGLAGTILFAVLLFFLKKVGI